MNEASEASTAGAILLQGAPGAFDPSFFLMLASIFLIFYFLVLRPENKRRREHEDALKGAEKGDTITTSGGLQGKVSGITDDILTVDIATLKSGERVKIKVQRSSISSVAKAGDKADGKGGDS